MSETESKPTLAELQRSAHEFLKKERWEPAYEVLMRASEQYPESADVFSDLAAAERALGHLEQAILHYQRALELDPKLAFVHNNLGNALSDKGLNRDAIDCFHRALVLQPRYPAALNNLANVLLREGRMDDAKRALERLFNLTRDFQPAFETVALLCEKQGDVQGAMNHYVSLAGHYLAARKPEKSLWAMEACRRLGHRSAGLEANRSAAFLQLGRFEDARDAGIAALRLDPNHANAHVNLATAYMALRDQPNAIALLRRAVELNPGLIEAYIHLGSALSEVGDYHGSLTAQHRALELDPNNPRAMSGLALGYQMLKRRDEALELYRRAIALAPNFAETHVRYGSALLAVGQYQEGFREHDWRRYETIPSKTQELYADTGWAGQALEGKTIALYWEQSLGDSLQFIRYAQVLKERGATVLVECQPSLQRLFAAQPYVDQIVTHDGGSGKPTWDYSASIVSLPHLCGTTLDTIPAPARYLTVPAGAPHPALASAAGIKVGLVWAGSPTYRNDRKRSIDLSAFEPLASIPGIAWFSLQTGPQSGRLQQPTHLPIQDLSTELNDWVDTAQLVEQLDLVITVDTAIAHLAAALGKQVWVLIPDAADWRWLLGRDDSPWYPTMRLFRQEQADAWEPVIGRVGSKLVELTTHDANPVATAVEPTA